ncbi:MAG: prephenate dehydratase [Heliobacteriaceae bacterium]|jgi:prephenate dehydratase|nr:prephenate dehydratase [Heliobacteriaceae bacterium]
MNFDDVQNIAYLGPAASFTEMAKDVFCDKYSIKANPVPMLTIKQVVEYVDQNPGSLGVMPVENSIEGTVCESFDSLMRTKNPNVRFLAETIMPINHCLLARTTEIYSIANIISHPQALAQCREFIHNEMPLNMNIIEAASTAEAARSLQNYNLTYAAIGSQKTADVYMLNVLKENINDDKSNRTRFVLIGDYETAATGRDKTSLAFAVDNKPGALLRVLEVFMKNSINLSYIVSRPSKQKFGEYVFFVAFDGHISSPHLLHTIEEVRSRSTFMRFFGSFER